MRKGEKTNGKTKKVGTAKPPEKNYKNLCKPPQL
jgi:hypothetical protein